MNKILGKEFFVLVVLFITILFYLFSFHQNNVFEFSLDIYYIVLLLFAIFMNKVYAIRIQDKKMFILTLIIWLLLTVFGNLVLYGMIIFKDVKIFSITFVNMLNMVFIVLVSISFWMNNPFYVEFYKSSSKAYIRIYKVVSIIYILFFIYNMIISIVTLKIFLNFK